MEKRYIEIREELKQNLTKERYEHSLGVSYISAALAMAHSQDIYKAKLAGLLHDCAKNIPSTDILKYLQENNIMLSENDLKSKAIWHAIYGPILAQQKYHIYDDEILSAIRYHTTGKENMSMLEKIVFIADYIEPLRNKAKNLEKIRKMAFKDMNYTIYLITKDTIEYLSNKETYINCETLNCLKYLEENGIYDK